MRYFGLHRPPTFEGNQFILFYTKKPAVFSETIINRKKRSNALGLESYCLTAPMILYSVKAYENYKPLYRSLYQFLNANPDSEVWCPPKSPRYWSIVQIDDDVLNDYNSIDDIINEINKLSKE